MSDRLIIALIILGFATSISAVAVDSFRAADDCAANVTTIQKTDRRPS